MAAPAETEFRGPAPCGDQVPSLAVGAVDRLGAGVALEGLDEHAIEPHVAGLAELFDADRHGLVAGRRGTAAKNVGVEDTTPPVVTPLVDVLPFSATRRCLPGHLGKYGLNDK